MGRSINDTATILCKKSAGSTTFPAAHALVRKGLAHFGYLTHEDLVAGNAINYRGSLEDKKLAVVTPIGFRIIATKCELLHVPEVCFFGLQYSVLYYALKRGSLFHRCIKNCGKKDGKDIQKRSHCRFVVGGCRHKNSGRPVVFF
jgi:hypothetical protein